MLENFLEHWKARGKHFDTIEENWKIIFDDLCDGYVEKLDELCDKGGRLTRTIKFLDKLEAESHVKCSEGVLIPYDEYHALHEMLSEDPSLKGTLREKRDKIFTEVINLRRIY